MKLGHLARERLRVNMSETLVPLEFTGQGEEGLAHVAIPCCGYDVDESRGVSPAGRVAELE
jgi:hypothetical protein